MQPLQSLVDVERIVGDVMVDWEAQIKTPDLLVYHNSDLFVSERIKP